MMVIWAVVLAGLLGCPGIFSESRLKLSDHDTRAEVSSLFTSMSRKSSPLYICDPDVGGIEWLPPSPLNCDLQASENDTARVVGITLFWTDISQQVFDGFECTATESIFEGYRTFFDSDWAVTEHPQEIKVTYQQCKEMVEQKVSPKGKELFRVSNDVFETGLIVSRTNIAYIFSDGYNETKTNYRVQKIKIGISTKDLTIQTTALTVNPCFVNSSRCATKKGFLTWDFSEIKMCRLKEGFESNCLMRVSDTNIILTCPDQKLSLHNIEFVSMCGVRFGYSQGIYFLQNKKNDVAEDLATPSQVRNLLTRPRSKRDAHISNVHPFEAEIKANLNFLYETIKKGTAEAIWKLEKKVCESNKAQLDLIIALSQSGHPDLTTKLLHKNDLSYRADFSGDVPSIYKCLEVYEYMFLERDQCIFEWPVSFLYNQKVLKGFMTPVTHTIIANPTNRTKKAQNCPRFYFKTQDYTVLLSSKYASIVNLPSLPQPSSVLGTEESLPQLSFVPTGNLEANSADVGTVFQMVREMQQREESTTMVREVEEHFIDDRGISLFGGLGSSIGSLFGGITSFVWSVVLPIAYLALAVFLFVVLSGTGMLPIILALPFKCCFMFRTSNIKRFTKATKNILVFAKDGNWFQTYADKNMLHRPLFQTH